jgi:hypothetical protein
MGKLLARLNPWHRLLSVHSLSLARWGFPGEAWAGFIASQGGNDASPERVNTYTRFLRRSAGIPNLHEEFGRLTGDADPRLRANLWATFLGGAAGSGTGSNIRELRRFLALTRAPFEAMEPANHLVTGGGRERFALAVGEGEGAVIVYSLAGDFRLEVARAGHAGRWFDPRAGAFVGAAFPIPAGGARMTPPGAGDWVLWVAPQS